MYGTGECTYAFTIPLLGQGVGCKPWGWVLWGVVEGGGG